jgi:hypothetical protein
MWCHAFRTNRLSDPSEKAAIPCNHLEYEFDCTAYASGKFILWELRSIFIFTSMVFRFHILLYRCGTQICFWNSLPDALEAIALTGEGLRRSLEKLSDVIGLMIICVVHEEALK